MSTETKTKHTAEPWKWHDTSDGPILLPQRNGSHHQGYVGTIDGGASRREDEANAARIVACVNACAGMEDPAEAIREARELLRQEMVEQSGQMVRDRYAAVLRALGG